jgi:hypothetical protein
MADPSRRASRSERDCPTLLSVLCSRCYLSFRFDRIDCLGRREHHVHFSRKEIQTRLHALDGTLDPSQCDSITARLNTPGRDRLAAMWEVVFLYAFSRIGGLKCEQPLPSGKRPDVAFTFPGEAVVGLNADITAVSDEGLDRDNPIKQLSIEIAREAKKVGLLPGGINYRTEARREPVRGGDKVVLLLPSREKLSAFIRDQVRPFLRRAKVQGASTTPLILDTGDVRLTIGYDGSRFSGEASMTAVGPQAVVTLMMPISLS